MSSCSASREALIPVHAGGAFRVFSRQTWLCSLAAAVVLAGCPDRPKQLAPDGSSGMDGVTSPELIEERAAGLRVPLPSGWTASADGANNLVVGPRGRAVMRIQRSDLDEVPSPEELQDRFKSAKDGAPTVSLPSDSGDDYALWAFRVVATDGGAGWRGFLGARRVEEKIFLCASVPGANDGDVVAAQDICERLGGP